MREEKEVNATGVVNFAELLTIAFIVLKLLNVIEWSWVWVLSPIWITVALSLVTVNLVALINR